MQKKMQFKAMQKMMKFSNIGLKTKFIAAKRNGFVSDKKKREVCSNW